MEKKNKGKVYRQSRSNRLVHWLTAASIFSLIITGFGQMPVYKRYNVVKIPGAEWLGDYSITLILHYIGAIVLIFIVIYHIFFHLLQKQFDIMPKRGDVKESVQIIKAMITKGEEPPSEKYLAEQRLAYAAIGIVVLFLILTGFIKIAKNANLFDVPQTLLTITTNIHNFSTIGLIVLIGAHLLAFIIKANRKLLPGMFSGFVDEDYVKHRHPLWYKKLKK